MLKIESGRARNVGIKFWEIVDAQGTRLTEFNHSRFSTILSGTPVYFMDLDVDPKFCENVQAARDVDFFTQVATGQAGIDADADEAVRLYIMAALLSALARQGTARTKYLARLQQKLADVAIDADAQGIRTTISLLQAHGIAK